MPFNPTTMGLRAANCLFSSQHTDKNISPLTRKIFESSSAAWRRRRSVRDGDHPCGVRANFIDGEPSSIGTNGTSRDRRHWTPLYMASSRIESRAPAEIRISLFTIPRWIGTNTKGPVIITVVVKVYSPALLASVVCCHLNYAQHH